MSSTSTSAVVPLLKLSLKFLNTIFFLTAQVPLFISYLFIFFFFPFKVFWFTKCKFVLVLKTIFFFFLKHKLHACRILNFGWYLPKHLEKPKIYRNDPKFFPKWNRVSYYSDLFTDIVFSGQNIMELITLNQT